MSFSITGIKFEFLSEAGRSPVLQIQIPQSPEWPVRKFSATGYALDRIQEESLSLQVSLLCEETSFQGREYQVRAVVEREGELQAVLEVVFTVQFGNGFSVKDHDEGFIFAEFDQAILWKQEVGIYEDEWIWQWKPVFKAEEHEWEEFARTFHRFYIVLSQPSWPWQRQTVMSIPGLSDAPGIPLLKLACTWAQGSKTPAEAATLVTRGLVESGLWEYQADSSYIATPPTNREMILDNIDPENVRIYLFKMPAFIDRMIGFLGLGQLVNCVDFAHMVVLLANCLGCGLQIGRLQRNPPTGETDTSFDLKPDGVISTGKSSPALGGFTYHEIAFLGEEFDDSARIFDASLSFVPMEEDALDENEMSLSPVTNMPLGDWEGGAGYTSRLAKNPEDCQPQPLENVILKLI